MTVPTETTKDQSTNLQGLTLIEVMISVSIIVIVTSFVFAQRGDFSRSINLDNIAYEIALTVRQAQSYGTTSLDDDIVGEVDDVDSSSYAVLFDTSSPQEFILYQNTVGNSGYQGGDELVESYRLPREMELVRLCVNNSVNDTDCNSDEEGDLVINFSRPNPDAEFFTRNGSSISGDTAVIVIEETESGNTDSIIVRSSGYITTQ